MPSDWLRRMEVEESEGWADISMPRLTFDPNWEVTILPPFGSVTVRFLVHYQGARVSVYFDKHERTGCFTGQGFWEVYPHNDDVARCGQFEADKLMRLIRNSIGEQIING